MATIIEMPKLSDTMTVGTLVTWLKAVGDPVSPGDMIAEIETDKATMELENFEDGVLLAVYVTEGAQVPIGAPICAIGDDGEDAPAAPETEPPAANGIEDRARTPDSAPGATAPSDTATQPASADTAGTTVLPATGQVAADTGGRIRVSPVARKIAVAHGLDLSSIKGTGPRGRIVKGDILAVVESGGAVPEATFEPSGASKPPAHKGESEAAGAAIGQIAEERTVPVSSIRAVIAQRLLESKSQIPHFYIETEVDAAPLAKMRADLNTHFESVGAGGHHTRISINDIVLKASVEALRLVPEVNCSWEGDHIRMHGAVHVAFAVAIEDGLVTPVIKDANAKSLADISNAARDLAARARDRKLLPEEMSGSTLTTTNLGMLGVVGFYGIINPPNAAILSVGATRKTPVVDEFDQIAIGLRMNIGLSGDHRAIDGASAARFLNALKKLLEAPTRLLV